MYCILSQSVSQSVSQFVSQSVRQSVSQSVSQSVRQSVSKLVGSEKEIKANHVGIYVILLSMQETKMEICLAGGILMCCDWSEGGACWWQSGRLILISFPISAVLFLILSLYILKSNLVRT
jgi:hypothetical protein